MPDPIPEQAVESVLVILAILGGFALASRALRATLRLALHLAEETAASGLADVSARRGDLTQLAERQAHRERARRRRRLELMTLALWTAWLLLPLVLGWLPAAYAPAALLWLAPRPLRPPTPPTRTS
jgi:hypothetical protein